jgi:hypothetical protein
LYIGDVYDNNRDMFAKGRDSHGEDHYDAKLTEEDVMRLLPLRGKISSTIPAKQFNVKGREILRIWCAEKTKPTARTVTP